MNRRTNWIAIGSVVLVGALLAYLRDTNQEQKPKGRIRTDLMSGEKGRAQVTLGEGADWGNLTFRVRNVRKDQRPIEKDPWFEQGGTWVAFDCVAEEEHGMGEITIGVKPADDRSSRFAFSTGKLIARNREAGARFLAAVAKGFHQQLPPAQRPEPLTPMEFNLAILGEGMGREEAGGFGGNGNWTATKLFLQDAGVEVEVFFNYNLVAGEGEFSEKDEEYRADLIQTLARAIRDGARPARTPEMDPSITLVGPKIEDIREIGNTSHWQFATPFVVLFEREGTGTRVVAVRPEKPDERLEIARMAGVVYEVAMADHAGEVFLIKEQLAKDRGAVSSADPVRLWRVDRAKGNREELAGPWSTGFTSVGIEGLSPGGRYVVVSGWQNRQNGKGNESMLWVQDHQTGHTSTVETDDKLLKIVKWQGEEQKLRALAQVLVWEPTQPKGAYEINPVDGKMQEVKQSMELGEDVSPGGAKRMKLFEKQKVVVTDVKTEEQREFLFHEEDRPWAREGSVTWASDRYLQWDPGRQAFIDTQTLKMSYLGKDQELGATFSLSPDFKWAVAVKDKRVMLGRIIVK